MKKAILTLITVVGLVLTSCYWKDWDKLHPAGSGGSSSASCTVASDSILYNTVKIFRASCVVDTGTKMSYSIDIVPIINAKCGTTACHGAGAAGSLGNTDLSFYGSSGHSGSGIDNVSAGDTTGSLLWGTIAHNPPPSPYTVMPYTGYPQLTTCERNKIRNWIHQGAQNN
ncbi:MAG: hypothetical protein ACYDCN_00795 [Bacteroidia bacterium]